MFKGLALSLGLASALILQSVIPVMANDLRIRVNNYSSATINQVYFTHVDNPNWGPDRLGQITLPPQTYAVIDPGQQQGYCMLDIEIVFDDGSSVTDTFDACSATDYDVTDQ
jgi:hypothetical protein